MPNDVTLTIKVKDGEVVSATKNLENLNNAANNVGKSGSSNVTSFGGKKAEESLDQQKRLAAFMERNMPQAASKAVQAVTEVGSASGEAAAGGISALTIGIGAAAAAVAAVIVVAVALAAIMVEGARTATTLAKGFADVGIETRNLQEETGLAAKTVSALNLEFEEQGRNISDLKGPMNEFRKLIGEAAAQSDDARKRLNLLGIDGTKAIYDIDGAFRTAVAAILKAPPGIDQARLAFAAFGTDGYKLIPFLQEFNGNVDAAIAKARDLGIMLSGDDVKAAREFNRAYTDVEKQIEGIKLAFGRQFLDAVGGALRDFTNWVKTNQASIESWASAAGRVANSVLAAFERIAKFMDEHPLLVKLAVGQVTLGTGDIYGALAGSGARGLAGPPPGAPNYDASLNPQLVPTGPDPAALEAQRAEMARKEQEAIERAKKDWDAAIESWKLYATQAGTQLADTYAKLREQFTASGDSKAFTASVTTALNQYAAAVAKADAQIDALENERAKRNKATENELTLLHQQQIARRTAEDDRGQKIAKEANDAVAAAAKKQTAEQLREAEEAMRKQIELSQRRYSFDIELRQEALKNGQITEQQFLDFQNGIVLQELETRKKALQEFQSKYQLDAKKRAEVEGELKNLDEEIFQQKWRNEHALTAEAERRREVLVAIKRLDEDNANPARTASRRADLAKEQELDLKRQLQQLEDLLANGGVNDALEIAVAHARDLLDLRNRELDAVIAINRAQLELDHAMDVSSNQVYAGIKQHMAEQETLQQGIINGWNKTYDAILGVVNGPLDKLDKKTKGFLSFLIEPLKALQTQSLNRVFGGILDKVLPGYGSQTDNPVAKPIVHKLDEIHKTLLQMQGIGGGSSTVNITGLGGGGILQRIFGGGSGTGGFGSGPDANNPYILHAAGGNLGSIGDISSILHGGPAGTATAGGGGILSTVFGKGGIFGKQGFGNNQGTYDAIGAIAGVVGSAIGGRAGNIIGLAGSGLSIGFMFGGPIGAAIGAGIGALVGIFMGDPKKKQDKNENMPKLTQGFSDAMTQLQQILQDIRSLNGDPDALVSKARDIRSQIASGFGIQFASKSGQKDASRAIAQELAMIDRQPDGLMAQIIAAAAIARGAADRSKRILPEFAGGYFADFFKPNGLIPGAFDGADNILAMISRGEAVLNPAQMARARAAAGFDVFAHAGIPNYPNASSGPKLAGGGIAGVGMQAPEVHVHVEMRGVPIDQHVETYLRSDPGVRTHLEVRKNLLKSQDITNL